MALGISHFHDKAGKPAELPWAVGYRYLIGIISDVVSAPESASCTFTLVAKHLFGLLRHRPCLHGNRFFNKKPVRSDLVRRRELACRIVLIDRIRLPSDIASGVCLYLVGSRHPNH